MRFCSNCGASVELEDAFCSRCGQALRPVTDAPAAQTSAAPPAPYAAPAPLPPLPRVGAASGALGQAPANPGAALALAVVRGSWLAAILVPVVTLVVAFGGSVALAVVQQHDRSDVTSILNGAITQTFAALGSPMRTQGPGVTVHFVAAPLLITLLALGAGALVFRLLTRRSTHRGLVIGDAIRTAVVFALLMLVAAIVIHAVKPDWKGFGADDSFVLPSLLAGDTGSGVHIVPSIAGATFFPAAFLLITLGISALRLRITGETGWLARVRDIVRGPLDALVALFWLTVPASTVFIGALELRRNHDFSARGFAGEIAAAPNLGIQALGLGVGSGYGQSIRFRGHVQRHVEKLDKLTDPGNLHWLLWFSIPLAIMVMAIVALIVVVRSTRRDALWSVLLFLVVLPGVLPVLGHYANVRSSSREYHLRNGVDLTELTLVSWGIAAVVCVLALLVSGKAWPGGRQQPAPAADAFTGTYAAPYVDPNATAGPPAAHEPRPIEDTSILDPQDPGAAPGDRSD
ncbi:MAG: zinc ribbon domain-containing protein [Marmoricola sp.]